MGAIEKHIGSTLCNDLNNDGIITKDWNDLMTAYKCFLGIEKNCNKINYHNWSDMKREYECFINAQ